MAYNGNERNKTLSKSSSSRKKRNDSKNVTSSNLGRRRFLQAVGGTAATTALAGCLSGEEGAIKAGHVAPTALDMGLGSQRSAEMAVEEINEAGGIMDRDVELVAKDSVGVPAEATSVVREMVNQDDIDVLIGTFVSEVALAISDFLAENNVPFICSGSASPRLTKEYPGADYDKYKNIFRINAVNTVYQAELLADYAEFLSDEHGWTSFAVTPENAAWTQPFSEHLPGLLEDRGLEVTMHERIARDTSDFTPILDSVEESGADVMLKTFAHIPGPGLLSTWRENEYPFAQEGVNVASMSPQFWDDTSGGCLYETTAESGAGGVAPVTDKTIPFTEEYQSRYDERPTAPMYMGFGTYDAFHVYKDAVEAAGTADADSNLDDIVDAMLDTDYVGTVGRVQFFGPDHEFPHDIKPGVDFAPYPVQQWQENGDGSKECVFPQNIATADHVAPPWMS